MASAVSTPTAGRSIPTAFPHRANPIVHPLHQSSVVVYGRGPSPRGGRRTLCRRVIACAAGKQVSDTAASPGPAELPIWAKLRKHAKDVSKTHLRDLLLDESRSDLLIKEYGDIYADFSRQNVTAKTLELLEELARAVDIPGQIAAQLSGVHVNTTEDRAVVHTALRAPRSVRTDVDGANVVPRVYEVLDQIRDFSDAVRSERWRGVTDEPLTSVVSIGIGGSYLGPAFVHGAIQYDATAAAGAEGRQLRFLANVDPVDVAAALDGLDPASTLVVVVSKTFTTTETMLNARTVRAWLTRALGEGAVAKHMVAVSTNLPAVAEFGIDPANTFAFWDWVGGRYSVTSAVGVLPLALQYGYPVVRAFLDGAHDMDTHFGAAPIRDNLPILLALFSVWNSTFLARPAVAILPYSQALQRFAAHIQQVSMESLGKGVGLNNQPLPYTAGEVVFGEPGTNGQHSFYQLIHQGQVVPAEFIGMVASQQKTYLAEEPVSNHDELMCNFFAQADALALGKAPAELEAEGVPAHLIPHKTFHGNRPSVSILLPGLDAFVVGQLLALYEHRVAVQGMVWRLNAFDQWGVELGKVLATRVRRSVHTARTSIHDIDSERGYPYSTRRLLSRYLRKKSGVPRFSNATLLPAALSRWEVSEGESEEFSEEE